MIFWFYESLFFLPIDTVAETVFYTMSVYFMSVNIKNTKYTLAGALIANIAGIVTAFFITIAIFGK